MNFFLFLILSILTISVMPSFVKREVINNFSIKERIIGGQLAKPGQFPFMVALIINKFNFGGGTVLNSKWVLTAAHCLYGIKNITLHFGITNLKEDNPNKVTVVNPTFNYHPQFNPLTLANDIGFIKLKEPLIFNEFIQPIQYLPTSNIPDNAPIVAAGWGYTSNDAQTYSNELYYVHLTTVSNKKCVKLYGTKFVRNSVGCFRGDENEGTCHADSGGPIIQIGENGSVTHVGIISFGSMNGCENTDFRGYTRTFEFLDYIKNVTGI